MYEYTYVCYVKYQTMHVTILTSAMVLAFLTTSMKPVSGPVAMQPYGMRARSSPSCSHNYRGNEGGRGVREGERCVKEGESV